MKKRVLDLFNVLFTLYYCIISGLPYKRSWYIRGRIYLKRHLLLLRLLKRHNDGVLIIGDGFQCISKPIYNTIGTIQNCFFNISTEGSKLIIGNNVGISGSTINATDYIEIGDNTIIGSGCLITDSDSHPLNVYDRINNNNEKTQHAPIYIGKNVFVGARSIILKGVTIGDNVVIGAGSVVSKSIPSDSIVAGNPARIIRSIKNE